MQLFTTSIDFQLWFAASNVLQGTEGIVQGAIQAAIPAGKYLLLLLANTNSPPLHIVVQG